MGKSLLRIAVGLFEKATQSHTREQIGSKGGKTFVETYGHSDGSHTHFSRTFDSNNNLIDSGWPRGTGTRSDKHTKSLSERVNDSIREKKEAQRNASKKK